MGIDDHHGHNEMQSGETEDFDDKTGVKLTAKDKMKRLAKQIYDSTPGIAE